MLTREQLLCLFDRSSTLTSQPDIKKRIADTVQDKLEAASVTTAIQEEVFQEMMGMDPRYGTSCLGKINAVYENDRDLMIRFYKFLAKEELACDEAEVDPSEFSKKVLYQENFQEQRMALDSYVGRWRVQTLTVRRRCCQQSRCKRLFIKGHPLELEVWKEDN